MKKEKIYFDAYFDNRSLSEYWGLGITNSDYLSPPEPILNLVEIPGANKKIDLSESLTGHIQYRPRKVKLECVRKTSETDWNSFLSSFMSMYLGQEVRLKFKGDTDFYFTGRPEITKTERLKNVGYITIEMTVDPFKYEDLPHFFTLITDNDRINGDMENFAMPTTPQFVVPNDCILHFDGKINNLKKGTNIVPEIVLYEGHNPFWTENTKEITIQYQRGCF